MGSSTKSWLDLEMVGMVLATQKLISTQTMGIRPTTSTKSGHSENKQIIQIHQLRLQGQLKTRKGLYLNIQSFQGPEPTPSR